MSGYTANPSPSLVPLAVQTGAKARGFSPTAPEFTAETDSPLERDGFELFVPRHENLRLTPIPSTSVARGNFKSSVNSLTQRRPD
jgi:hypothetical protein